ncbi:CD276 antigen homolog isoform X2 [Etheostoma spectabile]|uniref:CD276 antigen homolog isoform X2 n=1 Tax=Etheostoma spectabile TaxID=54343 RepID=UPI0013AFD36C|nr:CD276 antigen homolog isoform X2 [Etheostoma spectabile]
MSPTSLVILLLCAPIMDQIPLQAPVGRSILIPCSLPANSSESLKWFYWQEDQSHDVLFYWNPSGKTEIPDKYRDRVEAFNTELSSGNISVRLNDVVVVDDKKTFYASVGWTGGPNPCDPCCESTLQVSAPYQDLVLTVNETTKNATCTARGGYPRPRVSWTGQNKSGSAQLHGALTELLQDPTEKTFSVESSVSVKDLQSVTCLIYNPHSNQTIRKNVEIYVSDIPWRICFGCTVNIPAAAAAADATGADDDDDAAEDEVTADDENAADDDDIAAADDDDAVAADDAAEDDVIADDDDIAADDDDDAVAADDAAEDDVIADDDDIAAGADDDDDDAAAAEDDVTDDDDAVAADDDAAAAEGETKL